MTEEQSLDIVEKAIDKAFERGKKLSIHTIVFNNVRSTTERTSNRKR